MVGNVMVIDDSPVDRKIIGQILKKKFPGIRIFETNSGLNLSEKIRENKIHMCILDIMMPEKNGFQVLREMKEDLALMDIPVIVCTGIEDKKAIEKSLNLGAYDYFSKPLSEEVIKISLPLKVKNAIELMKRNKEIMYLSYHDKLTGLYNRRFCEEQLKELDSAKNLPISLILGDVNGLKLTNDAFGHEVGDRLLIKIAHIIRDQCRENEIVGRIGGDEFLIVLPRTKREDVEKIVNRIKERCEMEKEDPIKPSVSMGYYTQESIEEDIMDIYKIAEDKMYNTKLTESKSIRSSIISTLRRTLHERSHETEAHSNRLMKLVDQLGKKMGLSLGRISDLKLLALLHDIGITAIPDSILNKSRNLTSEEKSIMKNHCEIGYRIANSLPDLAHIANDILSHHEHWDGKGYPQGLSGKSIPLNARIISVLDIYDLMVNGGTNRIPKTKKEALRLIEGQAGKYFDPKIVEAFIDIIQ